MCDWLTLTANGGSGERSEPIGGYATASFCVPFIAFAPTSSYNESLAGGGWYMLAKSANLHARVDPRIKEEAELAADDED